MSNTTSLIAVSATSAVGAAVALRAWKRSKSPTIQAKLSCQCGAVQGELRAKRDDTVRLYCYCQDCRDYANAVEGLGKKESTSVVRPCGETRLIQVCKDAVSIHKGVENLALARKSTESPGMYRYFASCCNTPMMNTIDFLGFVGVMEANLDKKECEKCYGPFQFATHEAVKQPTDDVPDIFAPTFIWNIVRYLPWKKAGPFDYSLKPALYWGGESKKEA